MESHAQSVEDNLIDSLSFKLRPGASYVTDRRSVSFFHTGWKRLPTEWRQGNQDYAKRRFLVRSIHGKAVHGCYEHHKPWFQQQTKAKVRWCLGILQTNANFVRRTNYRRCR